MSVPYDRPVFRCRCIPFFKEPWVVRRSRSMFSDHFSPFSVFLLVFFQSAKDSRCNIRLYFSAMWTLCRSLVAFVPTQNTRDFFPSLWPRSDPLAAKAAACQEIVLFTFGKQPSARVSSPSGPPVECNRMAENVDPNEEGLAQNISGLGLNFILQTIR